MNRDTVQSCPFKLDRALEFIERNALWVIACWTLFYAAIALFLAHEKPFWNDELFTFYISRLPAFADVWKALLTGAEQLPPFFFVITRAVTAVFGPGEISFRLPEIFGFWLMSIGLFCFLRIRLPVVYAVAGMTFPLITAAFGYAYEARPYGLVLGFSASALCCWQAAALARRRTLWLIGLALSIAAAISCHYYAVLGFTAIFVGECVRSLNKRRFDLGIWSAFAAGFIPLIFFLPLIKAARSYSSTFWSKPKWANVLGFYNALLTPAALALFILLIVLGMYAIMRPGYSSAEAPLKRKIPLDEIAAILAFSLIPLIGIVLAKAVTGAFNFRYALPAVIGLSVLVGWTSSALARNRTGMGLLLLLTLLVLSVANGGKSYLELRSTLADRAYAYNFVTREASTLPLVIADPHLFFELSYDVSQRRSKTKLLYLANTALALKYTDTDTVERGLLTLKRWAPLDVRDFNQFCAKHDAFLVYGYPAPFGWLVEDLIAQRWTLVVKARSGNRLLYIASRPHGP